MREKTMKIKALQAIGINKVELTEFPKPAVKEDAMLIRIHYCGVCGTDMHGIQGKEHSNSPSSPAMNWRDSGGNRLARS